MLVLMGVALATLIWIATRSRSAAVKLALTFAAGAAAVVALYFLRGFGAAPSATAGETRGNGFPWRDAVLFVLLVGGMLARGAFDALNEYVHAAENAPSLPWKKRLARMALPLLPAVMLFQPVLSQATEGDWISWQLAVFSFQNGFFWDALFDKIRPKTGGTDR